MDQPPHQPDPAAQLQRDLYYQAAHSLRAALPPPVTHTQDDLDRRDRVAIATVASLCPVNAEETTIAVRYVVAHTHMMDCMRVVRENPGSPAATKSEAQFRGMMRHANGTRSLLLRVQAARHKREKDAVACNQDVWTDHIALRLMGDALGHAPPKPIAEQLPPEPVAVPLPLKPAAETPPLTPALVTASAPRMPAPAAETLPPAQAPAVAQLRPPMQAPAAARPPTPAPAAARPQAEPPSPASARSFVDDGEPSFDPAAEAERYAIIYPRRARLIRRLGGLPDDCDFGPPEPELVQAIVAGTSPELRALDGPAAVA